MPKKNDALVLEVWHGAGATKNELVRVDHVAASELGQLQRATGLPASVLASRMIHYAFERVEVVERSD